MYLTYSQKIKHEAFLNMELFQNLENSKNCRIKAKLRSLYAGNPPKGFLQKYETINLSKA